MIATGVKSGRRCTCTRWLSRSTTNTSSPCTAMPLGRSYSPRPWPRLPTAFTKRPSSASYTTRVWLFLAVAMTQLPPSGRCQTATESISSPGLGVVMKPSGTGTAAAPKTLGMGRDEGSRWPAQAAMPRHSARAIGSRIMGVMAAKYAQPRGGLASPECADSPRDSPLPAGLSGPRPAVRIGGSRPSPPRLPVAAPPVAAPPVAAPPVAACGAAGRHGRALPPQRQQAVRPDHPEGHRLQPHSRVHLHREMQVRAAGETGIAGIAQHLAQGDLLPWPHRHATLAQVRVQGHGTVVVQHPH